MTLRKYRVFCTLALIGMIALGGCSNSDKPAVDKAPDATTEQPKKQPESGTLNLYPPGNPPAK